MFSDFFMILSQSVFDPYVRFQLYFIEQLVDSQKHVFDLGDLFLLLSLEFICQTLR